MKKKPGEKKSEVIMKLVCILQLVQINIFSHGCWNCSLRAYIDKYSFLHLCFEKGNLLMDAGYCLDLPYYVRIHQNFLFPPFFEWITSKKFRDYSNINNRHSLSGI